MEQRQITIVVGLIKNESGEILLGLRNRPDLPDEHNKWELPGGNIEFGETPEEALKREVGEETGLEIKVVRLLPKVFSNIWRRPKLMSQVLILAYECRTTGGRLKTTEPEISEVKFFKPEEIDYRLCLPKTDEIINSLANH